MSESTLAAEVRRLRLDRGLSQQSLADAVGVSQGNVAHIESGRNKSPDVRILAALCRVLGTPLDRLVALVAPDGPVPAPRPPADSYPLVVRVGQVSAGEFAVPVVYAEPRPLAPKFYPRIAEAIGVDVVGMSCARYGILEGDTVIVVPGLDPAEGQFVVCQNGDGFTLKGVRDGVLVRFGPLDGEPMTVGSDLLTTVYGTVIDVIVGKRSCLPAPKPAARKARK